MDNNGSVKKKKSVLVFEILQSYLEQSKFCSPDPFFLPIDVQPYSNFVVITASKVKFFLIKLEKLCKLLKVRFLFIKMNKSSSGKMFKYTAYNQSVKCTTTGATYNLATLTGDGVLYCMNCIVIWIFLCFIHGKINSHVTLRIYNESYSSL